MTELESLKNELQKRGFTRSQTESKICLGVLEVVSNSDGRYTDMSRLEKEIQELDYRYKELHGKVNRLRNELADIIEEVDAECDKRYKATMEAVEAVTKALAECETPEARDTLKTAQMFVNTIKVKTKYDNTAFIIGLASILTQGKIVAIDKLIKISDKIPRLKIDVDPWDIYDQRDYKIRDEEEIKNKNEHF